MSYNELAQRGTIDFPIEYYYIDETHARYDMSAHWHSEMEIIRVLEGTLKVKLNDRTYRAKKGDVVIVNSEVVHGAFPQNCKYECIVFHVDFFQIDNLSCRYFFESLLNHEYLIKELNEKDSSGFYMAAESLFDAIRKKSSGYKFAVIGAVYKLFGTIIDEHRYSSLNGKENIFTDKNVPKLKKVLTYMRKNYDRPITLDDMSKAAGMSPKYFCYFFKEMTGKTPLEYLVAYRIECATKKLISTDLSVTNIAFACGFNDLSYFIKTFKAHKGITPAKFRKS